MSAQCTPVVVTMSEVTPQQVRWLVANRIPAGKVTLFVGDPGLGKSFVALDLAARVSQGRLARKGDVILLSAEDDPSDTIRPRLEAAEADLTRIHHLKAVKVQEGDKIREKGLCLDRDIAQIAETIKQHTGTVLVIIDPLSAYMGSTDANSDEQVRSILTPLTQLAADTGVAIVCIKHLNKAQEKAAIYRTGGSIGFVAASRMAWMFRKDPTDRTKGQMLLLKSNLGKDPGGLAYSIETTESGQGRVAWEPQPINASLDDVIQYDGAAADQSVLESVKQFLQSILKEGAVPANDVQNAAKQAGISEASLRRAAKLLKIKRKREGFGGGARVLWSLPQQEKETQ